MNNLKIERTYVLLVGARGGEAYSEGEEILGPNTIGPFATREDAQAAAQIIADYWKRDDVRQPFGEPYFEIRELTAPTSRAVAREAENWITTEPCDEYDGLGDTCMTCGFTDGEHPVPEDDDDEDED